MKECVLVTGASRGIGKAIAIEFIKNSHPVIVTCLDNEYGLVKLLEEVRECNTPIYPFSGDLGNSSVVKNLYKEIENAVKNGMFPDFPHIIINNAGVSYVGVLQDMDDLTWKRLVDTNMTAPFYVCRTFLSKLLEMSHSNSYKKNPLIINISSQWALSGASAEVGYSATKAGLDGFTRSLALELTPSNIDVISFRLGMIDTDMNAHFREEDLDYIKKEIKNGKIGTPKEVGEYIYHIVNKGKYKTGDFINAPFGWMV